MKKYLAMILSLAMIVSAGFIPQATAEAVNSEYVYYYTDFNCSREDLGWRFYGADPGAEQINVKTLSTGESVLSFTSTTAAYGNIRISTPSVTDRFANDENESRKPLVFEYRVRIPVIGPSGRFIEGNNASGSSAGITIKGNAVRFKDKGTVVKTLKSQAEWHTVSIVYNSDAATRSLYIDGEFCGVSDDTYTSGFENNWYHKGIFFHTFWFSGNKSEDHTSELQLDYVKIYEAASDFDISIRNSKMTGTGSLVVDLTSTPVPETVVPSAFVINGKAAEKVVPLGNNGLSYEVVFDEALDYETTYELAVSGIKSAVLAKALDGKFPSLVL